MSEDSDAVDVFEEYQEPSHLFHARWADIVPDDDGVAMVFGCYFEGTRIPSSIVSVYLAWNVALSAHEDSEIVRQAMDQSMPADVEERVRPYEPSMTNPKYARFELEQYSANFETVAFLGTMTQLDYLYVSPVDFIAHREAGETEMDDDIAQPMVAVSLPTWWARRVLGWRASTLSEAGLLK